MINPEAQNLTENRFTLPADVTLDELLDTLIRGKIPVNHYGIGSAKTINHLLSEVNEGEAVITIDGEGAVYREVTVLGVDVLCELSDGSVYYLREDRQEFKDGRMKRRKLDTSIGEKLKPFETPEYAVRRALGEELGVCNYDSLYSVGYDEKTFVANTFPGIESTYKMHKYISTIPETEFQIDGYIEYQTDKTNYYTWELIRSNQAG